MTGWQILGVVWALGALLTAGGTTLRTNRGTLDFGGRLLVCTFIWPPILVIALVRFAR